MADGEEMVEHLRGPWRAFLTDTYGFIYESAADIRENAEDPEDSFEVSVRRGTAADTYPAGCRDRVPGSYSTGDMAYELDGLYLDDEDPAIGVEARFAQAQAMAAGLNAAWGGES